MKKYLLAIWAALVIVFLCTGSLYTYAVNNKNVEIKKINNNVWIHTSIIRNMGTDMPANGMIISTSKGIILIDTPWNNKETATLLKIIKSKFHKNIILAIITHAHADRIGGINTLIKHKIHTVSTEMTLKEAVKNGYKKPDPVLSKDTVLNIGNQELECYYPGPGHTSDNIVVWLPQYKILFGGCIIKSAESKDLGDIKDANIKMWPESLKKLLERYKDAVIVVPGHGKSGGTELILHSLKLLKK